MDPRVRSLRQSDLAAMLGIGATLHGLLLAGDLPTDISDRIIRRLMNRGALERAASTGDLSILLHDLTQRLHWAMGHGEEYPPDTPRQTSYFVDLPTAESATSCLAALSGLGALSTDLRVTAGQEDTPTEGVGPTPGLHFRAIATFPEAAPEPGFDLRVRQLTQLAERYNGQFAGSLLG
ncbi:MULTISPECIES: hypothetical protein [Micromonospora]|uniref:Uncharacterized protein n=1 Tax=Micromonospora endolithica TaxID=230091 RepID=A0A3A9ZIH5_9ACTN|nr:MULTISPECIES: hypothetical protein [Micromonospora]RKN48208.1 hypothetical protein D7223_09215 [Micromonospora endolithica]